MTGCDLAEVQWMMFALSGALLLAGFLLGGVTLALVSITLENCRDDLSSDRSTGER